MLKKMINMATPKMVELYQSCIGRSIRRLQKRLAKKAIRDPEHRFGDLFNLMYNPKWVKASLKLVLANKGSRTAGNDGITKEHLKDEKTREAFIRSISYEMKNDLYKPEPAKRVYIDKPSGGKRPLGIPTLKDRVVQQTLKLIIEPIFESDFLDYSIGFRPNYRCHDALRVFYNNIQSNNKFYWVIEGDISSCFDNISHKILMRVIKKRIKDKSLLRLIRDILKAGYIENGKVNKPGYGIPAIGTPQGGIISPLFANIYLHQFDKWFDQNYGNGLTRYQKEKRRKEGYGNAILIRYADDFVILWNGSKRSEQTFIIPPETAVDVYTMKEQVKQWLEKELELNLAEDKTLITHVNSGFDFLGIHVKRYRTRRGIAMLTTVPDDKVRRFKKKIQMATRVKGAAYEAVSSKIMAVNSIINGWAEYYSYTNWKAANLPVRLDYWINERMFRWAKGKHSKLPYMQVIEKYRHRQIGYGISGRKVNRWNFGLKTEASYVTDGETLWLEKLVDKGSKVYRSKKKLNPFVTFQYEVEVDYSDVMDKWEGRSSTPYTNDDYWNGKKLALKRDKYRCRLCGKKVTVGIDNHCHHKDGNSNNHRLDNLITLCTNCHYETYGKENEYTF
jgi:group II intron reverse transcriptase/maturase